jgi:hypothetical protein
MSGSLEMSIVDTWQKESGDGLRFMAADSITGTVHFPNTRSASYGCQSHWLSLSYVFSTNRLLNSPAVGANGWWNGLWLLKDSLRENSPCDSI